MIKVVQLASRKTGMTRSAFKDHYEHVHVPLILKHLPFMTTFRRNYPILDDPATFDERTSFAAVLPFERQSAFDVLTEMILPSREELAKMFETYMSPSVHAEIVADERIFVKPKSVRRFIVDVFE